jgi:cell fate regulator YaaT (PSP1 superfamily)
MAVFDAEFTLDRRKLTFYYHSEVHVDFRELVKDMFAR